MTEEVKALSASEQNKEDWMNAKWRPAMGWMYMVVCMMDMVVFPILWSLLQATTHGSVNTQWNPLTLQGAGLFHIAMGAVLGLAAWGRTQEKMAGANNGGAQTTTPPSSITTGSIGSPATVSSGSVGSSGFGATAASAPAFGSKPAGPAQNFPAL
jgi:hypothetical protein